LVGRVQGIPVCFRVMINGTFASVVYSLLIEVQRKLWV
jgi:hypothetical protein